MLEALPLSTAIFYCLFSTFVYYQQLHLKNFRGASKVFESVLSLFAFAGMITGLVFLIYYGWTVVWWAPVVLFIISLFFQLIANLIERITGPFFLSLTGFLAWPVCAYLMFNSLPTSA